MDKGVKWFHLQGIHDIAGLPYLILITIIFSFIFLPLVNLYMRFMEYQADQYGVSVTGKRDSFISALEKLSRQNLSDRKPNAVVEFLFYNHPSIAKRISHLTHG
jgi:Zn-dependent protease with chaperone function